MCLIATEKRLHKIKPTTVYCLRVTGDALKAYPCKVWKDPTKYGSPFNFFLWTLNGVEHNIGARAMIQEESLEGTMIHGGVFHVMLTVEEACMLLVDYETCTIDHAIGKCDSARILRATASGYGIKGELSQCTDYTDGLAGMGVTTLCLDEDITDTVRKLKMYAQSLVWLLTKMRLNLQHYFELSPEYAAVLKKHRLYKEAMLLCDDIQPRRW